MSQQVTEKRSSPHLTTGGSVQADTSSCNPSQLGLTWQSDTNHKTMVHYDPNRARKAVQFLVDSSYFAHHVKKLRSTVVKPRALPFKDDAEPLNELLVVGRQSLQAMENLIKVAEVKRSDRNDYQRLFMAAKRQRDRKVLALEELLRERKISPEERVRCLQHQYEVWHKERDALLAELIGTASWSQRNERLRQFWEGKEREIEALIVEAQNQPVIHKPKPKRVVLVKNDPKTPFGQSLQDALKQQ